jgi:hypothetical protein
VTRVESSVEANSRPSIEVGEALPLQAGLALPAGFDLLSGVMPELQMAELTRVLMSDLVNMDQFANPEAWYRDTFGLSPKLPANPYDIPAAPEGDFRTINQLTDTNRQTAIGYSSTQSLASSGCMLSVVTMAGNRLNGTNFSLADGNERAKSGGGYDRRNGAMMNLDKTARAMGVTVRHRGPVGPARGLEDSPAMSELHQGLERGELGMAGVDYKVTGKPSSAVSNADHFVLITGQSEDRKTLYAKDPAGGRDIQFNRAPNGVYVADVPSNGGMKHYRITEVATLAAADRVPALRVPPRKL